MFKDVSICGNYRKNTEIIKSVTEMLIKYGNTDIIPKSKDKNTSTEKRKVQ
jgi:hypothetical protein